MRLIRAGIDVTPLRSTRTGIGFYLVNLLRGLRGRPDLELAYFTGAKWITDLENDPAATAPRAVPVRLISRTLGHLGPLGMIARELFNQLYVRRHFNSYARMNLGVVHGMNFHVHGAPVPEIVTVFDISCFRHPDTHPASRVAFQRKYLPRALASAAHIITISEFSRDEIVECFGVPPARITVTPCAAGPQFHPRPAAEVHAFLKSSGLTPGNYLLTVGTLEPRKNLATLARAHALLPLELQRQFPLVIVGVQGWKTAEFEAVIRNGVCAGTVKLLGYVPEETLPWLYAGAAAFAYPSVYEGFGLPPLEALASGIPTVVSACSSLPEVVGDAALKAPPLDTEHWRQCLLELLEDSALRRKLSAMGPARARLFSWTRTADLTLDVYRSVA